MTFSEAISLISNALEKTNIQIDENKYDGLIIKKLESSNTLDDGRSTNQTHIAITGEQMDIFPYLYSDGYFNDNDADLKKYFVLQIPMRIYKSNIKYLTEDESYSEIIFENESKELKTSIIRCKRRAQADQIQISLINHDEPGFVSFRRLLHKGTYMIILKVKEKLRYEVFGIKEEDASDLKELNNHFYKTETNTLIDINSLINQENTVELTNKQKFEKYYFEKIEEVTANAKEQINLVNEFQEEYPLQRIKGLLIDEYALGKVGKEKTLSYKLEFGKYKGIVGIGGGTSKKHGAFWRNKGETLEIAGQNIAEDETDEKWNEFRNELYTYLNEYGTSNDPLKRKDSDEFSLLKGMDIVLTKMLFQYYPDRFVSIVAKSRLIELLDYFEYNYEGLSTAEDLNFALTKQLKNDFEFLENKNLLVTGWILWDFLFNVILQGENTEEDDVEDSEERIVENYSKDDFLNEVYISEEKYDDIVSTLKMKKNIILEGAPRSWKNIYG